MFKFWMDPKPNSFTWNEKARGEGTRAVLRQPRDSDRARTFPPTLQPTTRRDRFRFALRCLTRSSHLFATSQRSTTTVNSPRGTSIGAPPSGCVSRPRHAPVPASAASLSRRKKKASPRCTARRGSRPARIEVASRIGGASRESVPRFFRRGLGLIFFFRREEEFFFLKRFEGLFEGLCADGRGLGLNF